MTSPPPAHPGTPQLVPPHRGPPRSWLQRRRSTSRGRFELAIIGGGAIALALAGVLPGLSSEHGLWVLLGAGVVLTWLANISGLVPSLTAAFFAPFVVALTDPMWTLGSSIADYTLGSETSATFAVFVMSALIGSGFRQARRARRRRQTRSLWRARPQRKSDSMML